MATEGLTVRIACLEDAEGIRAHMQAINRERLTWFRGPSALEAGAFRVAYYLSDDASIATDDLLLATRTLVSLAAGGESSDTTVIVIPPGTVPGTWWLGLVVDDLDSVAENDEDDNNKTALPSIEVQ